MANASEGARPLVSVVLSFYNEEDVLGELIDRLRRALETAPVEYELVFVNDASTDRSLAILEERARNDRKIRVLTMSRNFGGARQGVCTLAGIEHARGDAVIFMDTDLQDPPELLPRMIETWTQSGADVVFTTRRSRAGEGRLKMALTRTGYALLGWACEVSVPDESGDFKLVSRRVADLLTQFPERWPFLRGMVPWVGFRQERLFYDRAARPGGKTHYPVLSWRVINNFIHGIVSHSWAPLRLALWFGAGLTAVAAAALAVLAGRWLGGACASGWVWTLAALGFLAGLQFAAMGVLGVYLSEVLDQARGRPRYIVASRIGFDED